MGFLCAIICHHQLNEMDCGRYGPDINFGFFLFFVFHSLTHTAITILMHSFHSFAYVQELHISLFCITLDENDMVLMYKLRKS